jgi:hypothetical protein
MKGEENMSCADFDDIKTICIEMCEETEERGVDTPSVELMIFPYDIP